MEEQSDEARTAPCTVTLCEELAEGNTGLAQGAHLKRVVQHIRHTPDVVLLTAA